MSGASTRFCRVLTKNHGGLRDTPVPKGDALAVARIAGITEAHSRVAPLAHLIAAHIARSTVIGRRREICLTVLNRRSNGHRNGSSDRRNCRRTDHHRHGEGHKLRLRFVSAMSKRKAAARSEHDSPQRLALSGLVTLGGGPDSEGGVVPDLVVRGRRALEWGARLRSLDSHVCGYPGRPSHPSDAIRAAGEAAALLAPPPVLFAGVQALLKVSRTTSCLAGPPLFPLTLLYNSDFPTFSRPWKSHFQGHHVDGAPACAAGHRCNF